MLRTISVRNFAIIETLDIRFGTGFNVLTGETGAGKSILMDALSLILGGRAGAEMVRSGCKRASIDAVFDVAGSGELQSFVREMGFDLEDDELLISRDVLAGGKSACRVSGRPATVSQLKQIGDWLVDLHGQHEHQSLLAVPRHLDLLDDWGAREIVDLRRTVGESYQRLQRLTRERQELEADARERARLIDLYRYQVTEIDSASLAHDEEDTLLAEHSRVANAQRLIEAAGTAASVLGGDGTEGVLDVVANAVHALEDAAALDSQLAVILETFQSALYDLKEVERDLRRYRDSMEVDTERLAAIEERIEILRMLKRKYGDTIVEVLEYRQDVGQKLDRLSHSDEHSAQLATAIQREESRLKKQSARLTALRMKAAREFQNIVTAELRDLALEKARFEVRIEQGEPTLRGEDRVEFQISTNPGEPLRPLARVASGGEISRVMLAIKSALARQEALPTMVFDEIDVGVGGRTATSIADKMVHLSRAAQILCITHLPQIAGRADHHFSIVKQVSGDRTFVTVNPLSPEQRVEEIARMLGGTQVTDAVLEHAREMLASK